MLGPKTAVETRETRSLPLQGSRYVGGNQASKKTFKYNYKLNVLEEMTLVLTMIVVHQI